MTDRLKERVNLGILQPEEDGMVRIDREDAIEMLDRITQLEAALSDAIDLMEQMGLSTMEHRAALHQGDRKP